MPTHTDDTHTLHSKWERQTRRRDRAVAEAAFRRVGTPRNETYKRDLLKRPMYTQRDRAGAKAALRVVEVPMVYALTLNAIRSDRAVAKAALRVVWNPRNETNKRDL